MTQKRLLLLGGSHAEIPLIKAAKALGYYTITTGNATTGLGHPFADKFECCDFSDKDAILKLAEKENISSICSGCNDFAMISTAYVAEVLGLPGHDSYKTTLRIHHKDKYRALAKSLNIPTPNAIPCETQDDLERAIASLTFPVIVKPVDLTGGKGIHIAETAAEARLHFAEALVRSRQKRILIEEFIRGSNHGFSAMLRNGKICFYFGDDEQYYQNKYLVSGASTPASVMAPTFEKLIVYSERIAKELSLVDGIFHIQYILAKDGTPYIIEICRRPPGDLYIEFVHKATGVDYPRYIIQAESGIGLNGLTFTEPQGAWIRHCVMTNRNGALKAINISKSIEPHIDSSLWWYKTGEKIENYLLYKAGILFLKFDTPLQMHEALKTIYTDIQIQTEPV